MYSIFHNPRKVPDPYVTFEPSSKNVYSCPPKLITPYKIQMIIRTKGDLIIWILYGVFKILEGGCVLLMYS